MVILFCVCVSWVIDAIADDTVRYQYVKKKGYVRLHTNKGDLNIELHCDKVKTFTNTGHGQPKNWGYGGRFKKKIRLYLQHFLELQKV